ncbi:hypothetical protein SAY86_008067 [Trapa natans]|uniref:PCI domain-containing protein n=1 Tax=Trapa natans TaxID=22666 RepID=A0AAN7R2S0_TRANT|nr:hypothetical protein SAY86_008067 [Trapa natans]
MSSNGFQGYTGPTDHHRVGTVFGQPLRQPSPLPPQQQQQMFQSTPHVASFPRPVPFPSPPPRSNFSYQRAVQGERPPHEDKFPQANQRSPSITSLIATHNSSTSVTAKFARSPDPRRNVPLQYVQRDTTSNYSQFSSQPRSPLSYEDIYNYEEPYKSPVESQRPAAVSASRGNHAMSQGNYTSSLSHPDISPGPPYIRSYDSRGGPRNVDMNVGVSSKIRSPLLPSTGKLPPESLQFGQFDPQRTLSSPLSSSPKPELLLSRPLPSTSKNAVPSLPYVVPRSLETNSMSFIAPKRVRPSSPLSSDHEYQSQKNGSPSFLSTTAEAPATKPISSSISKRTRSSSSLSTGQELQQYPQSAQDEIEREMQAKAKRLARFKLELIDTQNDSGFPDAKLSSARYGLSVVRGTNIPGTASAEVTVDYPSCDLSEIYDASEPSNIIIGLCPDMCPESERAERERKGDLDQYERVDGDRNHTSEFLAVKKYNRTAEREANLIRPMPVLQMTTDYLLNLLDQPYDDQFLGLYNFLWDRMRAVRMDLRMQHIFNLESMKMLEQMIRLHIIAMHELCEYEKGEGFSEGFDAHLNIEQMNKTSAELFQLYDDYRRKGIDVPTEREFRGYYALLKLDRHPGYKVEPAELSLDLAKMTPEIRQTSEIRFARDVARACRAGNFISFFRLAREASYLQACLMHAHFAKLRSQALASLHSGLQNNQGLPVSVVAGWLAMEGEDAYDVLHYHGFDIKDFEEPYMVKEGPFLNRDKDYQTKCSDLVHIKKSSRIMDDVISHKSVSLPFKEEAEVQFIRNSSLHSERVRKGSQKEEDEALDGSEATQLLKQSKQEHLLFKSTPIGREKEIGCTRVSPGNSSWNYPMAPTSPKFPTANPAQTFDSNDNSRYSLNFPTSPNSPKDPSFDRAEKSGSVTWSSPDISIPSAIEVTPSVVPAVVAKDMLPCLFNSPFGNSLTRVEGISHLENEEPQAYQESDADLEVYQHDVLEEDVFDNEDKVVAEAKMKLTLRAWKRHASKRRERRERQKLMAADALNSLFLGIPIRIPVQQNKDVSFNSFWSLSVTYAN